MSFTRRAAIIAASSTIILAAIAPAVRAHGYKLGDLEIGHPWTRATPPSARVAGGYLKITNKGQAADRLLSATFTGSATTEVHEMAHQGGVMTMRELPKGLEIRPGETVELKPGGFHLMFIGLKAGLKEKDALRGELVFEKAGRIEVEFAVEAIGARGGEHDHHGHAPARTN
jgi:periplasmic copper chaperone A